MTELGDASTDLAAPARASSPKLCARPIRPRNGARFATSPAFARDRRGARRRQSHRGGGRARGSVGARHRPARGAGDARRDGGAGDARPRSRPPRRRGTDALRHRDRRFGRRTFERQRRRQAGAARRSTPRSVAKCARALSPCSPIRDAASASRAQTFCERAPLFEIGVLRQERTVVDVSNARRGHRRRSARLRKALSPIRRKRRSTTRIGRRSPICSTGSKPRLRRSRLSTGTQDLQTWIAAHRAALAEITRGEDAALGDDAVALEDLFDELIQAQAPELRFDAQGYAHLSRAR